MLLTGRNLAKTYGPRRLFAGITLGLAAGEHVGLIGANGSGKSTLLKLFAGVEEPDGGVVERQRSLIVGYVPQADTFAAATPLAVVAGAVGHAHDPHEAEVAAELLLARADFMDIHAPVDTLSGGWRKRLAIVRELAREPDLILMDEPTNHLDLEGIEWLEDLIDGGKFGTLIVSHDRQFLEESSSRIVELSAQYPDGFLSIDGPYSSFVEKRAAFLEAQAGREQALASTVRREIAWLQRGAKARTTKAKGRIERAGDMMAELATLKARNTTLGAAGVEFTASGRQTRKLVELKGVTKSLGGGTLFRDLSLTLGAGTRLGLIGSNGSGKSTLIRILTGQLAPDAGTVSRAEGLRTVVFDQHRTALNPAETLRRALSPAGDNLSFQGQPMHVSGWAKRFLFRSEQLDMPVGELSGGEQSRVMIAQLMLSPADLLILDEPTNDLDIPTLDVLEESLETFQGAVVLVTHDRYLLDRASTDLLWITGEGPTAVFAELPQWERARAAAKVAKQQAAKAKSAPTAPVPAAPAGRKRLSWKEQKELETMEATIHAAEVEHARLQALASDPVILADHQRSRELFAALAAAQSETERLYARWEALTSSI